MTSVKMVRSNKIISSFDFLKEYLNHPCLWNKCDPNFENKVLRETAVQELTKYLHTDDPKLYIRKLKGIENKYYKELTNSYSILKSNPDAKLKCKPWVELAKRFFGNLSGNAHAVSLSEPLQAEDETSMTDSIVSTSSFTEIFEKECLNDQNMTEQTGQFNLLRVKIETDNDLAPYTCIKDECYDTLNIKENTGLEEVNDQCKSSHNKIEKPVCDTVMAVNAITSCVDNNKECNDVVIVKENTGLEGANNQYESSHNTLKELLGDTAKTVNAIILYADIKEEFDETVNVKETTENGVANNQYESLRNKVEEPFDETAMAVNAITSYDDQTSESPGPFVQIVRASTNFLTVTHTVENYINNANSKKRSLSAFSSTSFTTYEISEEQQRKVAKKNHRSQDLS